jgi:hypothetical protein
VLHAETVSPAPFNFALAIGEREPDAASRPRARIAIDPGKVERGLLKLVLSVVELIRQVMEKQAMRRIDAGTLTADQVDRLGVSLMEVEATIRQLQRQFGIEDLNIDLGPIGPLLDE